MPLVFQVKPLVLGVGLTKSIAAADNFIESVCLKIIGYHPKTILLSTENYIFTKIFNILWI
jgi:hypothetical protein